MRAPEPPRTRAQRVSHPTRACHSSSNVTLETRSTSGGTPRPSTARAPRASPPLRRTSSPRWPRRPPGGQTLVFGANDDGGGYRGPHANSWRVEALISHALRCDPPRFPTNTERRRDENVLIAEQTLPLRNGGGPAIAPNDSSAAERPPPAGRQRGDRRDRPPTRSGRDGGVVRIRASNPWRARAPSAGRPCARTAATPTVTAAAALSSR